MTLSRRGPRPVVLDLFCGAGGAGRGYHDAGFDVVGVDLYPQPNYPFQFFRADALEVLAAMVRSRPRHFAAAHASPPCQAYSDLQRRSGLVYPRLIEPVRELLEELDLPYVMENVPEAPLRDPVILCGTMFPGLRVLRHRGFEANWPLPQPPHPPGRHPLVFTYDKRKAHYGKLDQDVSFVQVTGGGNCTVANKLDAMGIDWAMTGQEANEAIPPAYTRHVGSPLMEHLGLSQELAA